jgi:hypothetical protein
MTISIKQAEQEETIRLQRKRQERKQKNKEIRNQAY